MDSLDQERMLVALEEARKALAEGEVPVGAALYRGKDLLWADHNRREQLDDPTAHAEILCLRRGAEKLGDWRLNACTLYVTLEPCPMCAGAILLSGISRCCFGAYDPAYGCCGSVYDLLHDRHFNRKTACTGGILEKECSLLLKTFFSGIRGPENQSDFMR